MKFNKFVCLYVIYRYKLPVTYDVTDMLPNTGNVITRGSNNYWFVNAIYEWRAWASSRMCAGKW